MYLLLLVKNCPDFAENIEKQEIPSNENDAIVAIAHHSEN